MAKSYILPFGKHKGRTLDEVLVADPEYYAWIQSQTDFLAKRADLARALQELGVTGDNTPLHNALQAMFLDDGVCEKLLRSLIRRNADEVLQNAVFKARKKRLLNPILIDDDYSPAKRRPSKLLAAKLEKVRARNALRDALAGSDKDLRAAQQDADGRRFSFPWFGLKALYSVKDDDLRTEAETELAKLDKAILTDRETIADLRRKIVEARAEVARLTKDDIQCRFILDERRMEAKNGSDVRIQCRLIAEPAKSFGSDDVIEWNFDLWLELKPFVADDYPNLLRQMETQRTLAKESYSRGEKAFVAVVGHYGGHGATLAQVKKMFREANFTFVLLADMGCDVPQIVLPSPKSVGELPLFGGA